MQPQRTKTYRVRRRQPTRLESQPREKRVRLDDGLERRRERLRLVCLVCLLAVLEEDLLALGADRLGQVRGEQAAEVGAVPRLTRLDVRRDGITDACREEACGGLHDDARVDEHEVRVLVVESVLLELAAWRVDDRERGARRVGRCCRRQHRDGQLEEVCDGLGGVNRLAAAQRDDEVALGLTTERDERVDLLGGGLATKTTTGDLDLGLLESLDKVLPGCVRRRLSAGSSDNFGLTHTYAKDEIIYSQQGRASHRIEVLGCILDRVRTLDVLRG